MVKRVSLKDIARMVGVSTSTVSFVLNGKAKQMRISEAATEKIAAVAKKAGYYPNQVAVSLRTGQTKILGLIVESIAGNFFASLARIIEDAAEQYGYKLVYCSTENNGIRGSELIRMLSQRQLDGYLVTPTAGMEKEVQQLLAEQKPVVLIDSYFTGLDIPHVLVNSYAGVQQGMRHLLHKGYRNIAWITVDLDLIQINERTRAYTDTLKQHKIKPNKALMLKLPYQSDKERSIMALCHFLRSKQADAIFFSTNYLGVIGLESITRLGWSIPQDIAMICFDEHDIFRLYPGGITVIQQPVEEIAQAAIRLLMQCLGKQPATKKEPQKLLLLPTLLERGSTAGRPG